MEKNLTPYEQSLTLKEELGFNEPCFVTFDDNKDFEIQDFEQTYDTFPSHMIASPLKSQVFRWFREKYRLHKVIDITIIDDWYFSIFNLNTKRNGEVLTEDLFYKTHEEAELACIDKLIQLIKEAKEL